MFTRELPEWNATGIKPPQTRLDEGWQEGVKPPAPWFNWWMNTTYQALLEVREVVENFEGVSNASELDFDGTKSTKQAIDDVQDEVTAHKADYTYQTPTIVGTQIRITKQSDTNRLYFKLSDNLTGGNITISTDAGATEKPLRDVEGNPVNLLEKGFVEVVADATFFTLRNRGISGADKQALIDIANEATANDSDLKAQFINGVNDVDSNINLPAEATWADILAQLPNIELGKKWASGETFAYTPTQSYQYAGGGGSFARNITISGLDFEPTLIVVSGVRTTLSPPQFNLMVYLSKEKNHLYPKSVLSTLFSSGSGSNSSFHYKGDVTPANVYNGGFNLPISQAADGEILDWIAFE